MWRTFIHDYHTLDELDVFLDRIEDFGYEPRFMRQSRLTGYKNGVSDAWTRVYIAARKKGNYIDDSLGQKG